MRPIYLAASAACFCAAVIVLDTTVGLLSSSIILLAIGVIHKPPPEQPIDYKNAYLALLDYLSHSDIDFDDPFLYATDQEDYDDEDDDDDSDFWKRSRPSNN